jgi:hypothetical protein
LEFLADFSNDDNNCSSSNAALALSLKFLNRTLEEGKALRNDVYLLTSQVISSLFGHIAQQPSQMSGNLQQIGWVDLFDVCSYK